MMLMMACDIIRTHLFLWRLGVTGNVSEGVEGEKERPSTATEENKSDE